jgi:hypothetical protein
LIDLHHWERQSESTEHAEEARKSRKGREYVEGEEGRVKMEGHTAGNRGWWSPE